MWHYAQSLLGVRNDDYNYGVVNVALQGVATKSFIRKVVFFPYTVTAADVQAVLRKDIVDSERCHIVLLAANARAQAVFIHVLRALYKHVRS